LNKDYLAPISSLLFCVFEFTGKERDPESGLDKFGVGRDWSQLMVGLWCEADAEQGRPSNPRPGIVICTCATIR
jgi:hypothetical protein